MGKIFKGLVKFTVAAAAVSGICYVFKDKIKESDAYKEYNFDEKINKVKSNLKEKMPINFDKKAYDEDAAFDVDSSDRGYVSIKTDEDDSTDAVENEVTDAESTSDTVPTIDL